MRAGSEDYDDYDDDDDDRCLEFGDSATVIRTGYYALLRWRFLLLCAFLVCLKYNEMS